MEKVLQQTAALAAKAVLPVVFTSLGGFVALTYPHLFTSFCQIGG